MRRANLLSVALTLVFAISFTPLTNAQMYSQGAQFPPGYGGHPHLIQTPRSHYQAPIVDQYVQHSADVWDVNRPIEKFLHEVGKRSWLRLEYMNWDYKPPGEHVIGAPVTGLLNNTDTFDTSNRRDAVEIPAGQTMFANMSTIDVRDKSGIRGTLGVALDFGSLEVSTFGFEKGSDLFSESDLSSFRAVGTESLGTDFRPNYAIPLLNNGAPSDISAVNSFVFDESISANMTTQMWGAGAIVLQDPYLPNQTMQWQWLGGFRYLSLDEAFNIHGIYNNGRTIPNQVTQIRSSTISNMYGPELGGRVSMSHGRVKASFTPRVMLGLNDYNANVNYIDRSGALVQTADSKVEFSSVTQLSFTTEVAVNDYCTLFAGYDWIFIPKVTRPHTNIRYNSTPAIGGGFIPDIRADANKETFYANGFSFGLAIAY